ncbi:MAG: ParA family protein [Gammaproteobacteria bacterium]|nr:ParA family protein [Gammaproteobacteria bacterium]
MTKIIAITNQKGGVGKTTTTINLAASFHALKRRVLLIDFDPQGNATTGSGVNKEKIIASIADVLINQEPIDKIIIKTNAGYDLLPANSTLTAAELQLLKLEKREYCLRDALRLIQNNYDFIFIDCPPALNILTVNALVAANSVLIPMQCEYYSLEGLAALLKTIEQLQHSVNPQLQIEGLLRTMFDGRNRLTQEVSEQLLQHFPNQVYQTVIPRNVRLAEAPSHGLPALLYDDSSPGAIAYLTLAGEISKQNTVGAS